MTFPEVHPTLTTERLVLRAHDATDVGALFALFTDPATMRYWGAPPWTERAQAEAMIERAAAAFAAREAIRFALAPRAGGAMIGTCTLFAVDAQNRRAEMGYILAPAAWGRGLMHEALTALLAWGFGPLGLHRVEADVDPRNVPSVKALERLGFVREGFLRQRWQVAGEVSDSIFLGLLAPEWAARRGGEPGGAA
jgi:RimJ/RimL family protein N-acetyltransferase